MSYRNLTRWADWIGGLTLLLLVSGSPLLAQSVELGAVSVAMPKYRLGIQLSTPPKALDEQLQLQGKGVIVTRVEKDSPAGKAGFKLHDVLQAIGEEPIENTTKLTDQINKAEGKPVTFKVLRAGQTLSITVEPKPLEGPAVTGTIRLDQIPKVTEIEEELEHLEERIREKLKDAGVDVRMQLIKPGKMLPKDVVWQFERPELPENLDVNVHKHGKEPAEIQVKRGEESWTVKEDELDKLPEDVRPHVESVLGRAPMRFMVRGAGQKFSVPLPPGVVPPIRPYAAQPPVPPKGAQTFEKARDRAPERGRKMSEESLEKQLEEMGRDLNRMHDRMEELRRTLKERSSTVQ